MIIYVCICNDAYYIYSYIYIVMYIYIYIGVYIYIYIPSGPQVSARGGVGWGMLTSCSWYVDGCGVGHVNVMFMVR